MSGVQYNSPEWGPLLCRMGKVRPWSLKAATTARAEPVAVNPAFDVIPAI
ncbi:hypothetical protein ITP53_55730 [Nonomuraea sp. K274]|uniref:Uncharacterized protein n=1 Tax=Nonomuraea cypriaca TaxID=1187855 RepID=A0A931APL6_9ACTN|nr:hypothetical protein [Nonomuraea cypriaca]MBF8194754.1 hypothetical protein [Nonomuraea cypriaca]